MSELSKWTREHADYFIKALTALGARPGDEVSWLMEARIGDRHWQVCLLDDDGEPRTVRKLLFDMPEPTQGWGHSISATTRMPVAP